MADASPLPISLALQGGGAHGAFTWGVLDHLLEDGRFRFSAVSGTSAGALNAASLATGLAAGGADAARKNLEHLWKSVSGSSPLGAVERSMPFLPLPTTVVHGMLERVKLLGQMISPYDPTMPSGNPLRPVLEKTIDFPLLQGPAVIPTFVSATRVDTGSARIFTGAELTIDALLASACLPNLFRAVEIDGISYWDGGYMGNPTLTPLFSEAFAADILIVQVTPFQRREVPQTVADILSRVTEITFNSSLLRDLRTLTEIQKLLRGADEANPALRRIARLRLHMIAASQDVAERSTAAKMDTRWSELSALAQAGREAATEWLAAHGDDIGRRSTVGPMLEPFI
ncbi:patatin-like phospholipase family protein [Aureimonas altamirensis]|uniref:patatin-like phospholipase family protein n=1 Tax=Aureimonas altamirensis TaxID=370622 RepID=UPI002036F37E|nr:patatin-like phospholipase family protein [Aureimonas altamirensis]MCM2504697.1 patatin-like phospholipase family protein [Aureimonas altamirensis]